MVPVLSQTPQRVAPVTRDGLGQRVTNAPPDTMALCVKLVHPIAPSATTGIPVLDSASGLPRHLWRPAPLAVQVVLCRVIPILPPPAPLAAPPYPYPLQSPLPVQLRPALARTGPITILQPVLVKAARQHARPVQVLQHPIALPAHLPESTFKDHVWDTTHPLVSAIRP
ncbi:hypothetical protein C369_07331 [Cryptococcus neoformans A5-35-17]|nr:hypothetical protein C369_07331 [Cryptococcus neoformans var. grubii A5-35-17]